MSIFPRFPKEERASRRVKQFKLGGFSIAGIFAFFLIVLLQVFFTNAKSDQGIWSFSKRTSTDSKDIRDMWSPLKAYADVPGDGVGNGNGNGNGDGDDCEGEEEGDGGCGNF